MAILVLLGTVVCASAVLPVDDPETPINEADAPSVLELALPTFLSVNLVRPAVDSIVLTRLSRGWSGSGVDNSVHGRMPVPKQPHLHSLQNLLCTFLI
jgi:hypothetical protein